MCISPNGLKGREVAAFTGAIYLYSVSESSFCLMQLVILYTHFEYNLPELNILEIPWTAESG